jgi:hypothetical protein
MVATQLADGRLVVHDQNIGRHTQGIGGSGAAGQDLRTSALEAGPQSMNTGAVA